MDLDNLSGANNINSPAVNNAMAEADNNLTPMTNAMSKPKSNYDIDVLRLIGQHLAGMGLTQTVNLLLEESGLHGLDHPLSTEFQRYILAGEFDRASSLVEELVNLVVTEPQQQPLIRIRSIQEMRLAIAEQKFLELIDEYQHLEALKCLRHELTPLAKSVKYVQHLATLIMCKSNEQVRQKANWPGKGPQSRQALFDKLSQYVPPPILLPPRRLSTLLEQAQQLQREHCILHLDQGENPATYQDLKQDHVCSVENFPLSCRQVSSRHAADVWYCSWSNDGTKLATAGLEGTVIIWQLDPHKRQLNEYCTLEYKENDKPKSVSCLSWSPNDAYLLACGSEDKPDIWLWNVVKQELKTKKPNHAAQEHHESYTTCSWAPSGKKFAASSLKGYLTIFDADGNRLTSRDGVRVQCLAFLNKDPNFVLAADILNRIKMYHLDRMAIETREDDSSERLPSEYDVIEEIHPILSFTIDKEDKYIAVNLFKQGIHLWDFKLRTLLRVFHGVCQRDNTIYSSFASPSLPFLASGSEDGNVFIYHFQKEQPVVILQGHTRGVNCVSWNPKHPELLASVSDDRTIRLWAPMDRSEMAQVDQETDVKYTNQSSKLKLSNGVFIDPSSSTSNGGGGGVGGDEEKCKL